MKKVLTIVCGLICSSTIFASQSLVVCPLTITCNYHKGTCDFFGNSSKWKTTGGDITPFAGSKTLNLVYIMGTRSLQSANLICEYTPSGHTSAMQLSINLKKFVGTGWIFNGWGDKHAHCQSIADPSTCAAK